MNDFFDSFTKRTRVIGLFFSGLFNLIYAASNILSGLFYHNLWYFSLTFLHSVIFFSRFYLLRNFGEHAEKKINFEKIVTRIGYSLILIDTLSLSLCFYSILEQTAIDYKETFIYPIVAYTIYSVIISFYGIFLSVKNKCPAYLAYRNLTLTTSLYTVFNLVYSIYLSMGNSRVGVLLVTFVGAISFSLSLILAVLLLNKKTIYSDAEEN